MQDRLSQELNIESQQSDLENDYEVSKSMLKMSAILAGLNEETGFKQMKEAEKDESEAGLMGSQDALEIARLRQEVECLTLRLKVDDEWNAALQQEVLRYR